MASLGINVLCTILLGASNHTVQCLSAPVREEIDKGHRKRAIFDIGVSSLKNLARISRRRLILWMMLALSSTPVHLLYDGVVLLTLSINPYTVSVVTPEFSTGAPFGNSTYEKFKKSSRTSLSQDLILQFLRKKEGVPDNLLAIILPIIYPSCHLWTKQSFSTGNVRT